jgi:hypothetical protein
LSGQCSRFTTVDLCGSSATGTSAQHIQYQQFLEIRAKLEVLNVNSFLKTGSRNYGTRTSIEGAWAKTPFLVVALYGLRGWCCTVLVLKLRAVCGAGANAGIGADRYNIRCSETHAYGINGNANVRQRQHSSRLCVIVMQYGYYQYKILLVKA